MSSRGNRFIAIISHADVLRELDFVTKPGERGMLASKKKRTTS